MTMIFLVQVSLIAAALSWMALARAPSKTSAAIMCAASALVLVGVGLAGIWLYPPFWMMALLSCAGFGVLAVRLWRNAGRSKAPDMANHMLQFVGAPVLVIIGGLLTWQGLAGRIAPTGESYDLAAPLQGDRFCVISGGASPLLNFHMETLSRGKEAYRGQSYGVDFIAVSPLGWRTRDAQALAPAPRDPSDYRIFGAEVRAPCAGEVVAAGDGMADQLAGVADLSRMAGNHVVLRCEGHDVLLAHLKQGSVAVTVGQRVAVGHRLGEVGNTGATDEPHLHLSVQRAADPQPDFGGAPVHVRFDGRFLARGQCL